MSQFDSKTGQPIVWLMRVIAVGGLCVAVFLAWSTLITGKVVGCGGGAVMDCNHVLQSKFSSVFGVPVSIPAAGLYVVLIVALFSVNKERWRQVAWSLSAVCICAAAAAALWFIGVQVFILGKLCWYCLIVHSCGLVLAALLVGSGAVQFRSLARLALPGVVAALTLGMLQYHSADPKSFEVVIDIAAVDTVNDSMTFDMSSFGDFTDSVSTFTSEQISPVPGGDPVATANASKPSPFAGASTGPAPTPGLSPVPPEDDPALEETKSATDGDRTTTDSQTTQQPEKRYIDFRFAKVKLNTYDWPIIGSPTAPHVLLELFDYTCPHCQQMNVHLKAARERYGEQVAILVLPVPLNKNCNPHYTKDDPRHADACELARLALSIWRLAPEKFSEFHDYLFTAEPKPNAGAARHYAEQLVAADKLQAYMSGAGVSRYIAAHANILQQAGGAPLPRVESEGFSLKGKTNQANDLFETLEARLGVRPQIDR